MASTCCIFHEQDTSWAEASHIAVACPDFHLSKEDEKELSIWRGMPVAEPTRRRMEQHEVLSRSEGRDVRWCRRREIDGFQLHFLVGEVRLSLSICVQTCIRRFCHVDPLTGYKPCFVIALALAPFLDFPTAAFTFLLACRNARPWACASASARREWHNPPASSQAIFYALPNNLSYMPETYGIQPLVPRRIPWFCPGSFSS